MTREVFRRSNPRLHLQILQSQSVGFIRSLLLSY